jgi:5-dehydro-2-deoxygluconokinase
MPGPELDVITIGRSSIDLYGQQTGGRLEDMASFAKYIGGSPTNTACGAARLGLNAGLITAVGDEHMGRFILEELQRNGVDTSHVKVDPRRLTALVILGIRDESTFPLLFYRENCADMGLTEDDIDEDYIRSAGAVVLSGTHFSTGSTAAASRRAARIARDNGASVAFDIDYRPVLWGLGGLDSGEERFVESDQVTAHLQKILPLCDLVVGTEEELHIAGGTTDTLTAIKKVRELTDGVIVCKRGPMGCVIFPGDIPEDIEKGIKGPGFPVEVYNVLGAGDAFMAGLLRGWRRSEDWETSAAYANACGAFAVSRHGCAPAIPTWEELTFFLEHGSATPAMRKDAGLNHIHWATTRRKAVDTVMALAIDHRSQFEDMAAAAGANIARAGDFKMLALDALRQVANGRDGYGILLDGPLGKRALHAAMDGDLWVARPVEKPGSRPVVFEPGLDIGGALAEWPVDQVVKCLIFYHPDDPEALKAEQERQALTLFEACRNSGHELLLEIICGKHGPVEPDTVSTVLQRLYDLGVRPDWWKLEPAADVKSWQNISHCIAANDPYCRGIVILGLEALAEQLLESFKVAAGFDLVRGFAVGRTIFAAVARDWLAGRIDDGQARKAMADNFRVLADGWLALRANRGK